jgi:hypothetical protein
MSIAHELSCDVAAAMLAERGDEPGKSASSPDLTGVVLEVHTTLRRLTREARRRRHDERLAPVPEGNGNAAAGGQ